MRTGRRTRGQGREHGIGGGHQGPVADRDDPEVDALGRAEHDVVAVDNRGWGAIRSTEYRWKTVPVSLPTGPTPGPSALPRRLDRRAAAAPPATVFRRPKRGTLLYVLPV